MSEIKENRIVKKGKKIRMIISAISIVVIIGIVFGTRYFLQLRDYKKRIADISITDADLGKIPDGSYKGSYDAIMVAATVDVDVQDHKITNITLVNHKNDRGKKAERIITDIQNAQSLKVDTVSGATNSSKVILKAVQNALDSSQKN